MEEAHLIQTCKRRRNKKHHTGLASSVTANMIRTCPNSVEWSAEMIEMRNQDKFREDMKCFYVLACGFSLHSFQLLTGKPRKMDI
jgi:hypothetical protein